MLILIIRKEGLLLAEIYATDNGFATSGMVGDNEYANLVDLMYGLQGFGIAIDDFFDAREDK